MTNPQKAHINPGLTEQEIEAFREVWKAETDDTLIAFNFSADGSLLEAQSGRNGLPTDWNQANFRMIVERTIHTVNPKAKITSWEPNPGQPETK